MRSKDKKALNLLSFSTLFYNGRYISFLFNFFLARLENLLARNHTITQLLMPEIRGYISQKRAETDKDRKRRDCGVDLLRQAASSPDQETIGKEKMASA